MWCSCALILNCEIRVCSYFRSNDLLIQTEQAARIRANNIPQRTIVCSTKVFGHSSQNEWEKFVYDQAMYESPSYSFS
ncbi:unnamed protein product [Dicrocoelium dendriticum]|nr:unnamed protein product [Dicrocoelium dendriticum]